VAGFEGDGAEGALLLFIKERGGGTDLTGSAVAALKGVVLEEGGLYGAEVVALGEAFNRGDLASIGYGSEGETTVYSAAVQNNGACSTLAVIAALFAAGQIEVLPESVEKGSTGIEGERFGLAVHFEGDRDCLGSAGRCLLSRLSGGYVGNSGCHAGTEDAGSFNEGSAGKFPIRRFRFENLLFRGRGAKR